MSRRLAGLAAALLVACRGGPESAGADEGAAGRDPVVSASAIADSLYAEARWPEAVRAYRGVLDSLSAAGDTAGRWHAELQLASALTEIGRRDEGRAGFGRALRLAGEDPVREARTRYLLSVWYDRQGRFEEALREATRVLELAPRAGPDAEMDALNAMGRIHSLSGRYREALAVHERYLALVRRVGTRQETALALNEIGIDYRHFGRFGEAVEAYREALETFRRAGDADRVAMVAYNLANVHRDMGEGAEAVRLYTEALGATRESGELRGRGFVLNALGTTYLDAGNIRAASEHFARGAEVNARAGSAYGLVVSLLGRGRAQSAAGARPEAAGPLERALALADSAGFARERASALTALAGLALRSGEGPRAAAFAAEAVALADSLADPAALYDALAVSGRAHEAMGLGERALATYRRATRLLESWRGRLALGDLRLGVTRPRTEAYEGAIRVLVRAGLAREAFAVAERARARLLLELMAHRASGADGGAREDRLRDELRERYAARTAAPTGERASIDQEIEALGRRLGQLRSARYPDQPARRAALEPTPAPLTAVQAVLGTDRTLLAYFWGEEDVYGWAATGTTLQAVRLGAPDSLAALVGFLRATVEDPTAEATWHAAARRAHAELVEPLAPETPEDLWIVPDGPLAALPFEVLIGGDAAADGDARAEPWALTKRIRYGPSASVLLALESYPSPRRWEADVLAVGNPTSGAHAGDARSGAPAVRDELPPGAPGRVLPPLTHAAAEARAVAEMFDPDRAVLLLGDAATSAAWRAQRPERYRYLHFAAHAVVSDDRPERTHIVMADGPLDLAAIRGLRIRAELVTLSACDTGLGMPVRGEGVIGLPHAFLAAGAEAVVVTLWRVTDRSAADFMTAFYRALKDGVAPAEALRRVRSSMLSRSDRAAHPSRWAPFILVGGAGPVGSPASSAG